MTTPNQYGSDGLFSYIVGAAIDKSVQTINGATIGSPALMRTDGSNLRYSVDVNLGAPYTAPLRQVPIASNDRQLTYAASGSGVTLTRNKSGIFEITGFSARIPGTYTRVPVSVKSLTPGVPAAVGLSTYILQFADLGNALYGGWGVVPWGAYALLQGGVVIAVRT